MILRQVLSCGCTLTIGQSSICVCPSLNCPCKGNYKLLTPCSTCILTDHKEVMLESPSAY